MHNHLKYHLKNNPAFYNVVYGFKSLIGNTWEGKSLRNKLHLIRKSNIQRGKNFPRTIAIEPISKCILDCEFCILRKIQTWKYRRKISMSFDEFKKIIDDISFFTTDLQFSGGEPLINKDIFKMFDYARKKNIYTLLATNGILLGHRNNMENVIKFPPDKILISYEALDKSTYDQIRKKGDYDKLISNIKELIAKKKESRQRFPIIILQMVLTKKNMHMEKKYFKAVKALGADYASIKALGVWPEGDAEYDKKLASEFIVPHSENPISRHDIDKNGNITFFRKPGQCPAVYHCYIGSGGEVLPCWYIAGEAADVMGNAIDEDFIRIWNSEKYANYRDKMLNDWANLLCHRCIGVGATAIREKV